MRVFATISGVLLGLTILGTTSLALAEECKVYSKTDLDALFKKISDPASSNCKIDDVRRRVTLSGGDKGTQTISLTEPLVIPKDVELVSDMRISFRSDLSKSESCLINMSSNSALNNIIVLNNNALASKNAAIALCAASGTSGVSFSDIKVIGGNKTSGIMILGDTGVIKNSRIKIDNGDGIYAMGYSITVANNDIDVKDGTAFVVGGQIPTITDNTIYASYSFRFQSAPNIPRSNAANIIKMNPSLLYDATGEYDEELYAKDNFAEIYAKDGYSGDLLYCPPPNGTPYYEANKNSLVCNPGKAEDNGCPKAASCPLGAKLQDGVCIIEKIIEKPAPDIGKDGNTPTGPTPFGPPPVANASGGGNCTLMAGIEHPATPIATFLMTITLTGLIAFRSQRKAKYEPVRHKKRDH